MKKLFNHTALTTFTAAATLALSLFAGAAQAKTIDKTFEVSAGGLLKLETQLGALKIKSHNKNTVEVEVEIEGRDEDKFAVTFDNSGNNVTINGEKEDSSSNGWLGNRLRVTYHIKVPATYNLDVDTNGGSIKISDLTGKVDARTSGGSITLGRVDGLVDIRTSGGSITVDEVTGTIKGHTSGGSVNATISKQPTGDSKLTTSGGSITVYLAADIAVDLSARTSGGRVSSDFEVDGSVKKKSIRGAINGGGPELVLKTSGGSVRVKKL
ncbi:MAG: hypothetical protein ACI8WB_002597 [Phenylobacterium sp.]|jgi:hypothetical protein